MTIQNRGRKIKRQTLIEPLVYKCGDIQLRLMCLFWRGKAAVTSWHVSLKSSRAISAWSLWTVTHRSKRGVTKLNSNLLLLPSKQQQLKCFLNGSENTRGQHGRVRMLTRHQQFPYYNHVTVFEEWACGRATNVNICTLNSLAQEHYDQHAWQ